MGMPTKTQMEAQSDAIAKRISLDLTGYLTELGSSSVGTVAALVDATGDSDYEGAMLAVSNTVDRLSSPENLAAALPSILARYKPWADRWIGTLLSAAGGTYASVAAYVNGLNIQVDPLFGELVRYSLNDAAFQASSATLGVFAPSYSTLAADRVYTGADGSLVDDTTDAGSASTADVALFGTDDFCLYIGSNQQFSRVIAGLSTAASATITPTFQYWNGSAWVSLTVTDNGVGFTVQDTISFSIPSDWARCAIDAGGTAFADLTKRYYVRISRTANTLVTPPVATCIRIVPLPVLGTNGAHLGVDYQPPLALVRITGAAAATVDNTFGASAAAIALPHAYYRPQPIRWRALTVGLTAPVLTPTYVDEAGVSSSNAQSALSSPAALDTVAITLASPDTGVRSITSCTVSSGVVGVVEVYVPRLRSLTL